MGFMGNAAVYGRELVLQARALTHFACVVYFFKRNVMDLTSCVGPSMLPTFHTQGDVVLIEFLSKWRKQLQKGDVVIVRSPTNPDQVVCKRIAGMPGDIVQERPQHSFQQVKHHVVPKGHMWLLGDNLENSSDSRSYGAVPIAMLYGHVWMRIWPLRSVGPIPPCPQRDSDSAAATQRHRDDLEE